MTGNVAMHLIGDEWHEALGDIARALVAGGRLVFDNRNPDARAWESWNESLAERQTPIGALRESLRTRPPDADGVVIMHCHNEFIDSGETLNIDQQLQFRSWERIASDLINAGLTPMNAWSDWNQTSFQVGALEPLMVIEATKN